MWIHTLFLLLNLNAFSFLSHINQIPLHEEVLNNAAIYTRK